VRPPMIASCSFPCPSFLKLAWSGQCSLLLTGLSWAASKTNRVSSRVSWLFFSLCQAIEIASPPEPHECRIYQPLARMASAITRKPFFCR
jgi:hypothetical protein